MLIRAWKLIFCILFFNLNIISNDVNQLVKAFHHVGALEGKLVFYFKNQPTVKFISKKCDELKNTCQEIFLFPKSSFSVSDEAQQMISKINNIKHPFYKIILKNDKIYTQLKIIYDTRFVKKIETMSFNAISLFKGVVFNILHKNVKPHIKNLPEPKGKIVNLDKPNVVIDMGHGGTDSGAIGTNNTTEKQITYCVGMKLKKILENKGYNVFLTRSRDIFVPLDTRTSMANFLPGKTVFVSIHANFSKNKNAAGLETYYADSSLLNRHEFNKDAIFIDPVLNKIKDAQNRLFAKSVHESVLKNAREYHPHLIDRKVRTSISQVLLGTHIPAILIELGFLSNPNECQMLCSDEYQDINAQAIASGIEKFFKISSGN